MKTDSCSDSDKKVMKRENRTLPASFRERYGTKFDEAAGIVVLRPRSICENRNHRPAEEFSLLVNDQPDEAICKQFDDSVKQLLYRAYSGDRKAAQLAIAKFGGALSDLRKFIDVQRDMTKLAADGFSRWPVVISVSSTEKQTDLKVVSQNHAPTPPFEKPGRNYYWLELAKNALEVCELNRHMVPLFLSWTSGSEAKIRSTKCWDWTAKTTFYHLPNGHDVIAISDWQLECAQLPAEINRQSFTAWWNVISKSVLEYWHNQTAIYAVALKEAGRTDLTEPARRKLAIKRLGKGFKIIVGLQREKVAVTV